MLRVTPQAINSLFRGGETDVSARLLKHTHTVINRSQLSVECASLEKGQRIGGVHRAGRGTATSAAVTGHLNSMTPGKATQRLAP